MDVGNRLGRPGSRQREKTLVFPRESPTMLAPGFRAGHACTSAWGFSHLGRQTESEKIPRPRNLCLEISSITSALGQLHLRELRTSPL